MLRSGRYAPALLLCAGGLLCAAPVRAQSFNCHRAHFADEAMICHASDLAQLDDQLASVFGRANAGLSRAERIALRRQEDGWVLERRKCGADHDCIARAYQHRIAALSVPPVEDAGTAPTAASIDEKPVARPRPATRSATAAVTQPGASEPAQLSGSSTPPRMAPPSAGRGSAPTITWVDPPPAR